MLLYCWKHSGGPWIHSAVGVSVWLCFSRAAFRTWKFDQRTKKKKRTYSSYVYKTAVQRQFYVRVQATYVSHMRCKIYPLRALVFFYFRIFIYLFIFLFSRLYIIPLDTTNGVAIRVCIIMRLVNRRNVAAWSSVNCSHALCPFILAKDYASEPPRCSNVGRQVCLIRWTKLTMARSISGKVAHCFFHYYFGRNGKNTYRIVVKQWQVLSFSGVIHCTGGTALAHMQHKYAYHWECIHSESYDNLLVSTRDLFPPDSLLSLHVSSSHQRP